MVKMLETVYIHKIINYLKTNINALLETLEGGGEEISNVQLTI